MEEITEQSDQIEEVMDQESDEQKTSIENEDVEVGSVDNELEDIDYDGKQYKLPRELKDALLRQSDYTKKTQEIAAERQRIDTLKQQAEQAVHAVGQFQSEFAELTLINRQIKALQGLDWNEAITENPVEAMKLQVKYNELINKRGDVTGKIQSLHNEIEQRKSQEIQKAIQDGEKYLTEKIPGWSTELKSSIVKVAKDIGFKDNELQGITDPRMVETLYYAKIGREASAKLGKQASVQQTKPTTVIKSNSSNQAIKDPDKMSNSEWNKWQDEQEAKRRNRK